ncbi:hypothetical protein GDO78_012838 [Eleutherodactylus coqui]|uniref:Uncharacterized protein n=1 Tax=Eleutherodactylus coqui TaxID=57060 RepID=A0A8J6F033_ELECQ|nr:hypothetical protein GDO78_012838 [Eleutherodactylus coqui]
MLGGDDLIYFFSCIIPSLHAQDFVVCRENLVTPQGTFWSKKIQKIPMSLMRFRGNVGRLLLCNHKGHLDGSSRDLLHHQQPCAH